MANADNIRKVGSIIAGKRKEGPAIVVVSALGGVTDQLIRCGDLALANIQELQESIRELSRRHIDTVRDLLPPARQSSLLSLVMQHVNEIEDICNGIVLLKEFSDKTRDRLLAQGELMSSHMLSAYLKSEGLDNEWIDARNWLKTDSAFTCASVRFAETEKNVAGQVSQQTVGLRVVPGFIASDSDGNTTTIGRGGSDYTAAIVGAALGVEVVEIWTDVPGMMTADPRIVKNARTIRRISFHEAMELSHFGAKVIYPPTLQPLIQKGIPVLIKNTFAPEDEGTLIQSASSNGSPIRGLSSINNICLLSLEGSGMVGIPGFSSRLFSVLARHSINVVLITQASSEHSICVGIEESLGNKAKEALDTEFEFEIDKGKVNPVSVERGLAIAALVGDNMRSHPGISGRMFGALGRNGVNVRAIAQGSSERNISAVVALQDINKAINVLHEHFFETSSKQLNLFIVGTGNVGSRFLAQLDQQREFLQRQLRIQARVVGLCNSKRMFFAEGGVDLSRWKSALDGGHAADISGFISEVVGRNLPNSVFVDMTASPSVASAYDQLLLKSISVVACNKIACSSFYSNYRKLKDLARDYNASFLFETNVGAGLPVIVTLKDLLHSGDRIRRIEAVLSGTLNYVFNHYDGSRTFSQVVRQAQAEGYTEPDPRLDLSGTDVMRKILILAREAGEILEMNDISNRSFLPATCLQGTIEDFYTEMDREEAHFRQLLTTAEKGGKRLKYVAVYEQAKASVGLVEVDQQHDLYQLHGNDNIVLFYTERYASQPLVVKGAGAGAEVTASGVFADIIRTTGLG